MENEKNIAGKRIRELRREKRLSQFELAAILEEETQIRTDPSAVTRIESGDRKISDYELVTIAKAFDVSLDWLCGLVEAPKRLRKRRKRKKVINNAVN